eukprot:365747-Chlamydomonas_euryale.AAC.17
MEGYWGASQHAACTLIQLQGNRRITSCASYQSWVYGLGFRVLGFRVCASLRNALRRSGDYELSRGCESGTKSWQTQNTRYCLQSTSEASRDKLTSQEGNSPEHQIRPLNDI